jgi:hypothetical protein
MRDLHTSPPLAELCLVRECRSTVSPSGPNLAIKKIKATKTRFFSDEK